MGERIYNTTLFNVFTILNHKHYVFRIIFITKNIIFITFNKTRYRFDRSKWILFRDRRRKIIDIACQSLSNHYVSMYSNNMKSLEHVVSS